jgi:eukaryotic-like serine/threonine-protein kinase
MIRQQRNPTGDSEEPADLFRSIKTKIAQRSNGGSADGITVDLLPVGGETQEDSDAILEAPPPPPVVLGMDHVLRGRYVIESQLGSGGMGTVYKALDRSRIGLIEASPHVAVKVLHEQTRDRPGALSKLRREFYCAQALAHPNVIKVYELDLEQEFPFFTMELVDGEILPKVMQKYYPAPLPRDYAWAVIREVSAGLAHAHDRGVVHGDMKPQNVMVTHSGEVRVLDFGRSGESATALTPAYASCDLLEGKEADPSDDLFALACLSYELLAGEHPFQHRRSTDARSLNMAPRRPPGLSRRQWKALEAGLAWDRESRPQSVREWVEQLDIGDQELGAAPERPDAKATPVPKSKLIHGLVALTAVALISGIAWAMLSRPSLPPAVIAAADSNPVVNAPANVDSTPADAGADEADTPKAPAEPKAAAQNRAAGAAIAAQPVDKTERISVASAVYSVRKGGKFAEVRVHRSSGTKGSTSFEWWTEPGSAAAGVDYAPQTPTTTFFPAGTHTVSLFIKVLPNESRKRAEAFYVVLGNPSLGSALGGVSKATVTLHP